ncbi:MFS transporter [Affinibrenneria salicis]|uniref:MFS transporter n=1 Tax=Affinibrenneria salicis TaxID=2590031 RepID=A0A5J5FU46_9GAMM|nr:MFS transporter [Affinibrenneria salicis]KAA8996436.1 MFS transporter [Affinibrenneria salicis]
MSATLRNNLILLALGQGLTGSIISLMTLTSTLAGVMLAPLPALSTLPITATVCGAAVMIYFVSSLMARYGRARGFVIGALVGLAGSALAGAAMVTKSFPLLLLATFVLGMSSAFNPYYRFAAAEIYRDPHEKNRAIAWVIGGGILGGFLGPLAASQAADGWADYPFLGSFVAAGLICCVTAILQACLRLPPASEPAPVSANPPPLSQALKSRVFFAGTASCAIAFVVMTLSMNAAPLAMHHHHFSIDSSATVLQWHFIAMYAPSLLLARWGARAAPRTIIIIGLASSVLGILVALSGQGFWHFLAALMLSGIGWALMFNGGTFLLNAFAHSPHKAKIQGINSLLTYLPNMLASLSVGAMMVSAQGWVWVNLSSVAILLGMACVLLGQRWRMSSARAR